MAIAATGFANMWALKYMKRSRALAVGLALASTTAHSASHSEQVRALGHLASDLLLCANAIEGDSALPYIEIQQRPSNKVRRADGELPDEFFQGMLDSQDALRQVGGDPDQDPAGAINRRFTSEYCSELLNRAEHALAP